MAFTYFFRDRQTLELVAEHALPTLKRRRYINVWDAGCAMGPEPYSIAIIFRENMGKFLFRNVTIYATDIRADFGDVIAKGVYEDEKVKRIPRPILERYFAPNEQNGHYQIDDEIRSAVEFEHHDLRSFEPIREELGLIVCKNVLLHLQPEERVGVYRMFHRALADDGFLVTEQTQKRPDEVRHLFHRVTDMGQLFKKACASRT
jgi:chemotaxis protein methyltransferase CheR